MKHSLFSLLLLSIATVSGIAQGIELKDMPDTPDKGPTSFALISRTPHPETKGVVNEQHSQLWGDKAAVRVKLEIEEATNQVTPTEMRIVTTPDPRIWQAALYLTQVPIQESNPVKGALWEDGAKWQMALQWWDNKDILRKFVRSVGEFPIELAKLEMVLDKTFQQDGLAAAYAYPRKTYCGIRWMNVPFGPTKAKINTPSEEFDQWLTKRVNNTPQLVFQIVRKSSLPGLIRRNWQSYAFKLTDGRVIALDVFELPEN